MDFTRADREQLIQACIAKNSAAQKALYDRYSSRYYALCIRYAGNKMDAEDILQNGFIKVFKYLHKLKDSSALEAWMKRIMINSALKHIAKQKKTKNHVDIEDVKKKTQEVGPISEMSEREILDLVADLPDGYRTVFNLYAIEGYKHKEIAELLEIEETTSRTQLLKARKLLIKKLRGLTRTILM